MKEGVDFPPICPNCGAAAARRLTIEKNFGSASQPHIYSLKPFFCDACIAKHRQELPPVPLSKQLRYLLGNVYALPALISLPLLLKFAASLTKAALAGDKPGVIFAGICMTFFSCILAWSIFQIRQYVRPRLLQPSTSVSSAFQFSTDMSQTFEPTWRRYTLRNPAYADAFAQLNQARNWDRHNPEAERARTLRFYGQALLIALFVAFGAYALYDDYLGPAYRAIRDYLEK